MHKLLKKVCGCLKTVKSLESSLLQLEHFNAEMGEYLKAKLQTQH
ncbi:MAG TPA: hypothetical protein VKS21_13930 [Spirochaetota bacterium]|nr:hypothetical protein [Spirochaetota bacterium]